MFLIRPTLRLAALALYTMVLAELFLRLFAPQPLMPRYITGAPWGVRANIADSNYRHTSAEVDVSFHINAQGMRADRGADLPVLLMVGRDDTVGGPRSVHRLADAYRTRSGLTDVTTLVYPGARHEIFNETMRAEVFADLLAWLDERFPARG